MEHDLRRSGGSQNLGLELGKASQGRKKETKMGKKVKAIKTQTANPTMYQHSFLRLPLGSALDCELLEGRAVRRSG